MSDHTGERAGDDREGFMDRVWRVLAEGYRQVYVERVEVLQPMYDREARFNAEARRSLRGLSPTTIMGPAGEELTQYLPVIEQIKEEGGSMLVDRFIKEAEYEQLCAAYQQQIDSLLQGRLVRAAAPGPNHNGFIVSSRDGLMRGTVHGQVEGLYACTDLASGGMYLVRREGMEDARHVYVPLFTGGDSSFRLSDIFVASTTTS